jgi:hypothetical protein
MLANSAVGTGAITLTAIVASVFFRQQRAEA